MSLREFIFGPSRETIAGWEATSMKEAEPQVIASFSDFIQRFSLTCRNCGKRGMPIFGTSNRYICACGNQFAGADHGRRLDDYLGACTQAVLDKYNPLAGKHHKIYNANVGFVGGNAFYNWLRARYDAALQALMIGANPSVKLGSRDKGR